jgi:hypothetical protein
MYWIKIGRTNGHDFRHDNRSDQARNFVDRLKREGFKLPFNYRVQQPPGLKTACTATKQGGLIDTD